MGAAREGVCCAAGAAPPKRVYKPARRRWPSTVDDSLLSSKIPSDLRTEVWSPGLFTSAFVRKCDTRIGTFPATGARERLFFSLQRDPVVACLLCGKSLRPSLRKLLDTSPKKNQLFLATKMVPRDGRVGGIKQIPPPFQTHMKTVLAVLCVFYLGMKRGDVVNRTSLGGCLAGPLSSVTESLITNSYHDRR